MLQEKEVEITEEQIQEMVDDAIRKQMGGGFAMNHLLLELLKCIDWLCTCTSALNCTRLHFNLSFATKVKYFT